MLAALDEPLPERRLRPRCRPRRPRRRWPSRGSWRSAPADGTGSSPAAPYRRRSRPTGSSRRGTRTPASPSRHRRRRHSKSLPGGGCSSCSGFRAHSSFAFVTGCQMAHVTCLAAARHAVYRRAGWNLPERGLAGAPPLRIVLGAARHVTVKRALRLLGIGSEQEVVLPADREGRMRRGSAPRGTRERRSGDRLRAGRRRQHRAHSTTSRPSSPTHTGPAPGSTSTVRSGSGPRRARRWRTSSTATPMPTPGQPTRTSG